MTQRISVSQIQTASECAYKWYLTYVKGVQRRPGEITPSALGDLVHKGLAAAFIKLAELQQQKGFYKHKGKFSLDKVHAEIVTAAEEEIAVWDQRNRPDEKTTFSYNENSVDVVIDELFYINWKRMVDNAVKLVDNTLHRMAAAERIKVLTYLGKPMVEFNIEVDITEDLRRDWNFLSHDPVTFSGKIDLVYEDIMTGNKVLIDFKVRRNFTGDSSEDLAAQLAIYQYILAAGYQINVPMAVVYQIKNDAPRKPELNKPDKNGKRSMSRAKITSTWEMYKDALLEAGLDPYDYEEEMKPKFAAIEYFRPVISFRQIDLLQKFWDNFIDQTRAILQKTVYPRAYGYACRACPFNDYCRAELYNDDMEELFETKYMLYVPKALEQEDGNDDETTE